ncbi:hypothetical protein HYH02_001362 [Chlamydomonas schloesseri]|uniref:Protein kinase domain-containing protein n=1 Tax=Chlamydomonas schloesseri TaxID=2026947 RepID=A0A835WXD5_9CHLO|nr:hypothetical protein HYH02_001362 [Chlamydomonas schloesseri]|eukprot:KAG2454336.1 hypothetical protein HYH02_001362 [Chlamydomonas schloesseri]
MDRQSWTLQDYHITNTLYSGYAAQVYTAACKYSGMEVVLKVYNDVNKAPDVAQHEMYREVAIQSSLQHHHIVHLFAAFQEGQTLVLVQEYAPGGDLLGLMAAHGGRVDEASVVKTVLRPLLEALLYLHRWGIVHRDVKPENVLFAADGTVKLADFGLAINMVEERPISRVGTLDYMAPEVLRCPIKQHMGMAPGPTTPARYGFATDCWAVGVVTFELLTGLPPYASDCRYQAEARIIAAAPPPFPHSMSHPARDFIRRLLAPIPGDRPTVRQLLAHPWVVDPDACVAAHLHHQHQHVHAVSSASAYHHTHLSQHPQQHASSPLAGAVTASSLSATAYSHAHMHALPPHPYAAAAAAVYSPYGSAHVQAHTAMTAAKPSPSHHNLPPPQQQQRPSCSGGAAAGDATCSVAAQAAEAPPCASGKQATSSNPKQHAAGPHAMGDPMLLSSYSTLPYTQASAAAAAAAAHHHAHAMASGYGPHPPHPSAYHPAHHYHGSHGALNTLALTPAPQASLAPASAASHATLTIPTFSAGKHQLAYQQPQPQQPQVPQAQHQAAASAAGHAAGGGVAESDPVRQLKEQLRALQQQQLLDLSKLPLDQIQSVIAKLQEAMRIAVAQQQQAAAGASQVPNRGTDGGATVASAAASPAPAAPSAVSGAVARAAAAGTADVQMEEAADVGSSQAGACGSAARAPACAATAATPVASGSCVHSSCHSPHSPLSVARHNAAAAAATSTGGTAPGCAQQAPHELQAAATPFAFAASLASHILHHASTAITAATTAAGPCDTASHASTATPSLTASRRTTAEATGPAVVCCPPGALTAEAVTAALLDIAHQQLQQQQQQCCQQPQPAAPTPMATASQCGSQAATPRAALFDALPHHPTIHSHAHTPLVVPAPPAAAPSTSGGGVAPMDRASGGGAVHDGDGLVYVSIGSSRKLPAGSTGGAPPQAVVVVGGSGGGGSSGGAGGEEELQQAARHIAATWFKPQLAAAAAMS